MNDVWKTEIKQDIKKLLDGKPTAQNAMLLAALIEIDEYMEEESEGEGKERVAYAEGTEPEEETAYDKIMGEIDGAAEYYQDWLDTKRPEYKSMAQDELRHSEQLLKFAREDGALSDEDFRAVKAKHGSILARLS